MSTEYIDCTPTTEATFRMLVEILKNGDAKGKLFAEKELLRYARWIEDTTAALKRASA